MSDERTTCLVAGGGPAGMVLGLLLARAGIDVTVLEKHGDFLRDFRGDTVHPTTLRLLDDLGLADKFEQLHYSKVDKVEFPAADDSTVAVADFSLLRGPYRYVAMVPQWDLLDMLAVAGKAEPTFHLRMNTEATEVITEHGRVAGVRYRTNTGATGELRADLTVAADGRWSTVRNSAGMRPDEYRVQFDTWWFRLPRHTDDRDNMAIRAADGQFMITIPRTDYYQIAFLAPKGRDGQLRAEGIEGFRTRIAELAPYFADRVDHIESMDDVKWLDVKLNRLRRWHTEGLLCIGDAAHAMSPVGGVGINLAVQDAVATATLLARPLLRHHVTDADLAKVQRRRVFPTVAVQSMQRFLHRMMFQPVMAGERPGIPPFIGRNVRRFPFLRYIPTYLIGVGFRPETAPGFARRSANT